jgi:tetratricopeptide (TPR) repeat protein
MKRSRFAPLAGALLLVVALTGCNKLKARDQLNKGVNAFRNAQFQEAIDHFQQAVAFDPSLVNARLYLAMSYFQQYAPGGESPDNLKVAHQAIDAFEEVLKIDSKNTTALATIGQIYYNMKDFDKAKEYQRRRLDVEPNDPEPYYWIGVIDWALCFKNNAAIRQSDPKLTVPNASGDLPPLPEKLRTQLANQNAALVTDGIDALQKAVDLKPNYDEAMAYLNLMYRQKADLDADSASHQADLKEAGDWLAKAMEARKQASSQPQGGVNATQ